MWNFTYMLILTMPNMNIAAGDSWKGATDMTESTIKAVLPRDIKRVWDTVTSLDHYEWRGDLDRIEIQDDKTFIEHTKSGYSTVFTVTACIPMERWEFDMENDNISGTG